MKKLLTDEEYPLNSRLSGGRDEVTERSKVARPKTDHGAKEPSVVDAASFDIDDEELAEAKKKTYDSMKRTSDFVGALVRLGLLATLAAFIYSRSQEYSNGSFYGGVLLVFSGFLSLFWVLLAFKAIAYTFVSLVEKKLCVYRFIGVVLDKIPEEKSGEKLHNIKVELLRGTIVGLAITFAIFALGGIFSIILGIALSAYYEIPDYLNSGRILLDEPPIVR
ncbi:hypothetical protein RA19_13735 [Leisingera sp. ANG-M1]|uniref:hypothetical protein n=1 Tax=Leisingera sp. ANG-M1 TaxID=1577895 RepID=UPI00057D4412|nr:hypothetical protein [Leisingera sp. ANG-M1]KIC09826.1 hypothetical protein RA19_13735 [Leisingera sp. ANG-M1]